MNRKEERRVLISRPTSPQAPTRRIVKYLTYLTFTIDVKTRYNYTLNLYN